MLQRGQWLTNTTCQQRKYSLSIPRQTIICDGTNVDTKKAKKFTHHFWDGVFWVQVGRGRRVEEARLSQSKSHWEETVCQSGCYFQRGLPH